MDAIISAIAQALFAFVAFLIACVAVLVSGAYLGVLWWRWRRRI